MGQLSCCLAEEISVDIAALRSQSALGGSIGGGLCYSGKDEWLWPLEESIV